MKWKKKLCVTLRKNELMTDIDINIELSDI